MLDIKFIRENPELVKKNIKKKFQDEKIKKVDELLKKDEQYKKLLQDSENLRAERNKITAEINDARKAGKDISKLIKKAENLPKEIKNIEEKKNILQKEMIDILWIIPNMISEETPLGKDESKNIEIKRIGKIEKFDFKIKNHVELTEDLGLVDFDASAKVSGNGFYYLKGELGLLNQALIRFTIDYMQKKGYEYIEPPLLLNEKAVYASMSKEEIKNSVYSIKDEDLNLIGTSEQSVLAMHSDNVIPEDKLPKKYFSYSMCFRKEIGSHGINEKGLWRTHQFNKVEQFVFCKPEDSAKLYDELLKNSEEIIKKLGLPYRVLEMCAGDLADWKYRGADLEVWRPITQEYGEIMSLSNCTDYQARKLNIRCSDKQGNKRILHTLNDTALATSRVMVAILENYQQKDGSIKIPLILQSYMNGLKKISKK